MFIRHLHIKRGITFCCFYVVRAWTQRHISFWTNAIKAILPKLWMERIQRIFQGEGSLCVQCFESVRLKFSSWCSLSKSFKGFSIQDINCGWESLIVPFSIALSLTLCLLLILIFFYTWVSRTSLHTPRLISRDNSSHPTIFGCQGKS